MKLPKYHGEDARICVTRKAAPAGAGRQAAKRFHSKLQAIFSPPSDEEYQPIVHCTPPLALLGLLCLVSLFS